MRELRCAASSKMTRVNGFWFCDVTFSCLGGQLLHRLLACSRRFICLHLFKLSKMPRIGGNQNRRRAIALYLMWRQRRINRRWWIHPLNLERFQKSEFFNLYLDLRKYDDRFFKMYRMHVNQFDYLLSLLRPHLQKQTTRYREPISPEERLVVTIT